MWVHDRQQERCRTRIVDEGCEHIMEGRDSTRVLSPRVVSTTNHAWSSCEAVTGIAHEERKYFHVVNHRIISH